jgi:hypothetical protein
LTNAGNNEKRREEERSFSITDQRHLAYEMNGMQTPVRFL